MNQDDLLKNRIFELSEKAQIKNIPLCTNFLNLHEQEIVNKHLNNISKAQPALVGGVMDAERKCLVFNDASLKSIKCLKVSAVAEKFSDKLAHRDVMGAILNLGIEYSSIGDIYIINNIAYVFCLEKISKFLIDNLSKIKHTAVNVQEVNISDVQEILKKNYVQKQISAESARIDLLITKLFHLSRSESKKLIEDEMVQINDSVCSSGGQSVSANMVVSVRSKGRFKIQDVTSRGTKVIILVYLYS